MPSTHSRAPRRRPSTLVSASGRFAEIGARSRRRTRRGKAAMTAAALVLLIGAWVVLASPFLAATTIDVTGTDAKLNSKVRTLAAASEGTPLARLDTSALEGLIEADPSVADATVRRSFPQSVTIDVVPRIAVLAVRNSKGEVDLIDVEGVAYTSVPKAPAGVAVASRDGSGAMSPAAVEAVLSVVRAMPPELRSTVRDIRISAADSVSFRVGKTRVTWGSADQVQAKSRLLQILLTTKPKGIDVSAPQTPVTT